MGWFSAPNSEDDESYIRWSQEIVLSGVTRFALAGGASGPVRLLTKRSEAEGEIVAAQWPETDRQFDTRGLPDGHYVAAASNCKPVDFVIRNGTQPVRGPFVPLTAANIPGEQAHWGHTWVPYSDPPPLPAGNAIAPRVNAPINIALTSANRHLFWMRPLTRGGPTQTAIKEWREDDAGNIHIGYVQEYARFHAQTLVIGNLRDGPYGVGGVGTPVSIRQLPDKSRLVVAINAGVKRIWPDLRVETVWGLRIPAGKPIPCMRQGATSSTLRQRYELVGDVEPVFPWDVCPDPDDSDIIWIANTDAHHVMRYRMSTHATEGFVGSPVGDMGRNDGIGHAVRMRRPRGLDIGPDGYLYVTQAWNHSIGRINRVTLEFTELVRSVRNWDTWPLGAPVGDTKGTRFHGFKASQLRAEWEVDGVNGVASFHHAQQCRFTSVGTLIFGTDHTRLLKEYDPASGIVKTWAGLPDGTFGDNMDYRHTGWMSIGVNRGGVGPMKDAVVFADWDQTTGLHIYNRNPTTGAAGWMGQVLADPAPAGSGTRFGRNNRCWVPGYPWAASFDADGGALVWGDSGSECVQEMSLRQPTDVDYPIAIVQQGQNVWRWSAANGLTLAAKYGDMGYDQLGPTQFQDMVGWTDAAIADWLLFKRPDFIAVDTVTGVRNVDAVVAYIRYSQMPAGVAPPLPANPTISNFTATPETVQVGGSVMLTATVTDAAVLELDGVLVPSLPEIVVPMSTRTYTLTARGAAGTTPATAQVTVTVTQPPPVETDTEKLARAKALAQQIVDL